MTGTNSRLVAHLDISADFVEQLHELLFNTITTGNPAGAANPRSDLEKITSRAAQRMDRVNNLVIRTREEVEDQQDLAEDDPLALLLSATSKFHRFVTTVLASVHLCNDRRSSSAAVNAIVAPVQSTASDAAPPRKDNDNDAETVIEQLEAQVAALELDLKQVRMEKAKMARTLKRLMQDPRCKDIVNGDDDPEVSNVANMLLNSSVSFHPDLATSFNEAPRGSGTAASSISDATTATPQPGGTPSTQPNGLNEQVPEDDGQGDMTSLFTIHAGPALDHSIAAHPNSKSISAMSANSVRSNASQIKTKGLTSMERAQRSKILSEKKWPYKLGNVIGTGAHGVVYLALMEDTGETVAAKQVLFSTDDPNWESKVKTLQTEISVLRKVEHDNIVSYLFTDRVTRHGSPGMLIFMEYVSGGSIGNLISHFGALHEKTAAIFMAQILLGLRHLHDNGVVHRDIKPANILLSPFGVVKLADFGTAMMTSEEVVSSAVDDEGGLVGTPLYMAPSAIRGEPIDWRVDIWGVGVSLMVMLTGQQPWHHLGLGNNPVALLHRIAADDDPLPMPPNLTPLCADFLAQCLRKDASERPSCNQLLRHAWFENYDVLMLSFNQNQSTGSLQIRPDVIENIGMQISDSITQRPVNHLAASVSSAGAVNLAASISHLHARNRNKRNSDAGAIAAAAADTSTTTANGTASP